MGIKSRKGRTMRKIRERCLEFAVGAGIGLVWALVDILTKNPINQLNLFNDIVFVIVLVGTAAFSRWWIQRRKKTKM
jgi:hypothetical protein